MECVSEQASDWRGEALTLGLHTMFGSSRCCWYISPDGLVSYAWGICDLCLKPKALLHSTNSLADITKLILRVLVFVSIPDLGVQFLDTDTYSSRSMCTQLATVAQSHDGLQTVEEGDDAFEYAQIWATAELQLLGLEKLPYTLLPTP